MYTAVETLRKIPTFETVFHHSRTTYRPTKRAWVGGKAVASFGKKYKLNHMTECDI